MTGNADDTTSLRVGSPALGKDDLHMVRTRTAQLTALLGLLRTAGEEGSENPVLELAYELSLDIHCALNTAE